ncbi:transglutaminase family protein [Calidifontibacter sp. DB0510]|uniref:Transglutaminase family protein n=1 Tax=Metallococcus carri TaxID=1656884 RepID=A0A967EB08_9MICO|nr:transglutaminase family protein [Metallococcus carri]NHN56464.1 transglutaminase family protein [Metallococcus carri]NOP36088.1 transglutaminase family protein [Calidifontibacter sp. DB2511S]
MSSRHLQLGCTFRYSSLAPTAAVFQVGPVDQPRATLRDVSWSVTGDLPLHHYRDLYGNPCTRLTLPTGVTTLTYAAKAEVPDALDDIDEDAPETPPTELPDDVLVYTLASRFCQPDVLGGQAWKRFGHLPPGYRRVLAIRQFVHEWLTYTTGSTIATATSVDVFTTGRGVCRDFAHLMITFCRALNIPARYVHGYMPIMDVPRVEAVMDFHAWTQVWLDGRWWDFDARWNAPRKGRVVVGVGRDAADVAMVTTYGAPWLQLMTVTCEEIQP